MQMAIDRRLAMLGLTGLLALIVIASFALTLCLIVQGAKAKNWKKVVIPAAAWIAVVVLLYYGLLFLITSM